MAIGSLYMSIYCEVTVFPKYYPSHGLWIGPNYPITLSSNSLPSLMNLCSSGAVCHKDEVEIVRHSDES